MSELNQIEDALKQIDPASFQKLCDEYLLKSRRIDGSIVPLGSEDGKDKTTSGTPDTYVVNSDGTYTMIEYTTQVDNLYKKVNSDIEKILSLGNVTSKIVRIIFCANQSNISPKKIEQIQREIAPIKFTFLSNLDISLDLRNKYRSLANLYLNLNLHPLQVMEIDDFVEDYNQRINGTKLDSFFGFRKKAVLKIGQYLQENKFVILTGKAGVGKTKLAYEYAKNNSEYRAYFINNKSLDSVIEQFSTTLEDRTKKLFIFDDANNIDQFESILRTFNTDLHSSNIQLLATVRDYAKNEIQDIVSNYFEEKVIIIDNLEDNEIKTCVSNIYKNINLKALDRIIEIAHGNIRIAMLGAQAYKSEKIENLIDAYPIYKVVIQDLLDKLQLNKNENLGKILGILSFLQRGDLQNTSLEQYLKMANLTTDDFILGVKKLDEFEIVNFIGNRYINFPDQNLQAFFLRYCFIENYLIDFERIIKIGFLQDFKLLSEAINSLLQVFSSKDFYNVLKDYINKASDLFDDKKTEANYFSWFTIFNPEESILRVEERLNSADFSKNDVKVCIRTIINLSRTSYFEYASKLLVKLLCINNSYPNVLPGQIANEWIIDKNTYEIEDFKRQISLFSNLISKSNDKGFIKSLILECIPLFLKFKFRKIESVLKNDAQIKQVEVNIIKTSGSVKFRSLLWKYLDKLSNEKQYTSEIKEIIDKYISGLCSQRNIDTDILNLDLSFIVPLIVKSFNNKDLCDCLIISKLFTRLKEPELRELEVFNKNSKLILYKNIEINRISAPKPADLRSSIEIIKETLDLYEYTINNKIGNFYFSKYITSIFTNIKTDEKAFKRALDIYFTHPKIFTDSLTANLISLFVENYTKKIIIDYINSKKDAIKDYCTYIFYSILPVDKIENEDLLNLKIFLTNEKLSDVEFQNLRSIDFLFNYSSLDDEFVEDCVQIINRKEKKFKGIYLHFNFTDSIQRANKIVVAFKNQDLCQSIYLNDLLYNKSEYNWNYDYNGFLLYALYLKDNKILKEYTTRYLSKNLDTSSNIQSRRLMPILNSDNSQTALNVIFDIVKDKRFKLINLILYLEKLVPDTLEDVSDNIKQWLVDTIKKYYDKDKYIIPIFLSLSYCKKDDFVFYSKIYFSRKPSVKSARKFPMLNSEGAIDWDYISVKNAGQRKLDALEKISNFLQEQAIEKEEPCFVKYKKIIDGYIESTHSFMENELYRIEAGY